MYKMRTIFYFEDNPLETINGFLYTSPQPFGTIKFDDKNYRIVRYQDIFSIEAGKRMVTRDVYLTT
jgi:hypothetical protein